jgi:hypothetical protein
MASLKLKGIPVLEVGVDGAVGAVGSVGVAGAEPSSRVLAFAALDLDECLFAASRALTWYL